VEGAAAGADEHQHQQQQQQQQLQQRRLLYVYVSQPEYCSRQQRWWVRNLAKEDALYSLCRGNSCHSNQPTQQQQQGWL
jgi:hypothetical protein